MLRAVVSDRDGIIHELLLKKRDRSAGYCWYYGNIALVVTPAETPEEAVRLLKQEISPTPDDRIQLISISRAEDGQP